MIKITEKSKINLLFSMCFLVYFTTYLGRLNYTASLSEIVASGSLTKEQAGLIGTVFFLSYGIGQFVSGFAGDKFSPKWLVFTGMSLSGILNLAMFYTVSGEMMAVFWGLNGFVQAFIWSPMVRMLYEYLETKERIKCCTALNASVPLGTMAAYGITALVIFFLNWEVVFPLASGILISVSIVWLLSINSLEKYAKKNGKVEKDIDVSENGEKRQI